MRKGRSSRLISIRNEKIILRYYFWREIKRRRLDDTFNILSEDEFHLDPITIQRIVRRKLDRMAELRKLKPTEKELDRMFTECFAETHP